MLNRNGSLSLLLALGLFFPTVGRAQDIQVVKYDGLVKEIQKHRGKVVLVDFWADFCIPCKKKMPKLVELEKTYGKEGLVVLAVAMDNLHDKERKAEEIQKSIVDFVKYVKATNFVHFQLDIPADEWKTKFRFISVPSVYIFDRQGKWTMMDEPEMEKVEQLVKDLLREK